MKKITLLLLLSTITGTKSQENTRAIYPAKLPIDHSPQIPSQLSEKQLEQAQEAISSYLKTAPYKDLKNLISYLRYYPSWYQAVTPAPHKIYEKLTQQEYQLIERLKEIAQPLTQAHPLLPGTSTLLPQGELFYQMVLKQLENIYLKLLAKNGAK